MECDCGRHAAGMSKGPTASGWMVAADVEVVQGSGDSRTRSAHGFRGCTSIRDGMINRVGRGERLGEKVHVATVCGLDGRDVFRQLECVQGISDQLPYGSRTRHGGMELILVIVLNIQRWRDDR